MDAVANTLNINLTVLKHRHIVVLYYLVSQAII
jgi:hypothetical protein